MVEKSLIEEELLAEKPSLSNQRYPKSNRLKTNKQYRYVLSNSKAKKGKYLVLHTHLNPKRKQTQFGIIASKHYGNAVMRNRFKRLSREAFRQAFGSFEPGIQLIVRPRKQAFNASMDDILKELVELAKRD